MLQKSMLLIMAMGLLAFSGTAIAEDFIHPLDFNGTKVEKDQVIKYIEENVKDTYSKIGMDSPSILRMMEKENLDAFKKLTKAINRVLLDRVIKTYCSIGMCNYDTINIMYEEELKESQKKLNW